jgi:heterogeneous nuclear ribonucleoprotein F/H
MKNVKQESYEDPNGLDEDKIQNGEYAIYLMTNNEGRPNGEAFIELETENDIEMAVKRNNALMGHRYIEGK